MIYWAWTIKDNRAFTLVKVSIIIIIIGLVIAGAVTVTTLIEQARLRSITDDISIYKAAYNNFYLKYKAIPGDMKNAFDYWGEVADCINENTNISYKGCNGNGNFLINAKNATSTFPEIDTKKENYKAWQFLALSGLIPSKYSDKLNSDFKIGENIPASQYSNKIGLALSYSSSYCSYIAQDTPNCEPSTVNGNYLFIGSIDNPTFVGGGFLTTADALAITTKIDNGMPKNGKLLGYSGNPESGIVTNKCTRGNYYDLSHNSVACAIMYRMYY